MCVTCLPASKRKPLPTVIDESAPALEVMYVSGGRRGLQVALAPADLIRLTSAVVAPLSTAARH